MEKQVALGKKNGPVYGVRFSRVAGVNLAPDFGCGKRVVFGGGFTIRKPSSAEDLVKRFAHTL